MLNVLCVSLAETFNKVNEMSIQQRCQQTISIAVCLADG